MGAIVLLAMVLACAAIGELVVVAVVTRRHRRDTASQALAARAQILALEEDNARVRGWVTTDRATGLGNATQLEDDWARLVALSRRREMPFSVIFAQVENAADPEKPLGPVELQRVASALFETARTEDHLYRLYGQVFAALLVGSDSEGAWAFGERVTRTLYDGHVTGSPHVALVVGVAAWGPGYESLEAFLWAAERDAERVRALRGSNRVTFDVLTDVP